MGSAYAQSKLPACPSSGYRHNCVGNETFANGSKYVGEFKDGRYNGQGTFTYADGNNYIGEWKDDKRNGQGTFTFADGNKYVGEFKDGKYNGQGTFTFADGNKYIGVYKDGKRNGQFTVTYADGEKYVGEFKDDQRNGQGIFYLANGSISQSGVWSDNSLVTAQYIDPNSFTRIANGNSAQSAAEAQRLAAARLAELPKPSQIIKDCADCPEMVVIPAGSFATGSRAAEQELASSAGLTANLTSYENPQRHVNIRSFAAGRYAISKGEFAAFVRAKGYQTEAERGDGCFAWNGKEWKTDTAYNWRNVGFAQADNHPVVCVSWNDAQAYIAWLNQSSGQTYRLLSEVEREYAARGGTQTAFWWGDSINTAQANYGGTGLNYNGSPKGEWRQATVPVNSFSPNPFGLYNVHGNVWEWVEDCWHGNYSGAPTDGSAWTTGCSGNYRVLRGGSWFNLPAYLRSTYRDWITPGGRGGDVGLRLARTLFTP